MELGKVFFADFETHAILPRPAYPPAPVGLALLVPGQRPFYHAWGHPVENNSSITDAKHHYAHLLRTGWTPCWHHAGFDLDVMETHVKVDWPAEHHDTLLLAFLDDPRSASFSLKPLAEKLLGEPPAERDQLRDWILANVKEARRAPKTWGAYIARAPGDLVGRYACGDVTRTRGLFKKFVKTVVADPEQRRAYERERRLTRLLIKMERRGVPVATRRLSRDVPLYERRLRLLERKLMDWLRVPAKQRADFVWSGDVLADRLEKVGAVKEWILTDKGNRSTSTDALREVRCEPKLLHELEVRAQLQTCLSTFMRPWLEMGREHAGHFYARYNQVRQDYHSGNGRLVGAETGRLSMTPNLQNAPRADKDRRIPIVRDYVVPGRGKAWIKRDYSQQELRITAHYEDGPFLAKYLADPTIDAHLAVGQLIDEIVHITLARREVKDLNFGLLYGMGQAKLALKLGRPVDEARRLFRAHLAALPGVARLKEQLKQLEVDHAPLYTWGGRRYFCEPPKYVEKHDRVMSFGYKLLNLKIQGSAADCTKQAMVNYDAAGDDDRWPLILQVHDELNALARPAQARAAHRALNAAMLDVDFKVPMLSDGSVGRVSWHQTKKVHW